MSFLEKVKFGLNSKGAIKKLLSGWKPKNCDNEKQYENSLYDYLHSHLESIQVTKQFSKGRTSADIMVGNAIVIELKHNLKTTAKYQRLLGQIMEYKTWEESIFIVLCGETEPNLRKELTQFLKKEGLMGNLLEDEKVTVIDKP